MCFKVLIFLKIRVKPIFDFFIICYGIFQILFSFTIEYLDHQFTFENIIFYFFILPWLIILSITGIINLFGSKFFLSRILKIKIDLNEFFDYCNDYIPLETNINSLNGKTVIDKIISDYLKVNNKNKEILDKIIGNNLDFFEKMKSILYTLYKKDLKKI